MGYITRILGVLIVFFSTFMFVNIDNVKADTSYSTSDGHAVCYYYGFYDYNSGDDAVDAYGRHPGDPGYDPSTIEGYSSGDYYSVYIYAYKDPNSNDAKRVWAELYMQENVQEQNLKPGALISQYKTNIDNHNEVFVAEKIWDKFNYRGTYRCPRQIYAYKTMVSLDGCPRNVAEGDSCATLVNATDHSSISQEGGNFTVTDPQVGGWRNFFIDTHDRVVEDNNPHASVDSYKDKIKIWGDNASYDSQYDDVGDPCKTISSNKWLVKLLNSLLWFIAIAALAIFLIMSIMDFIKAITGSDDANLKKAFKNLAIRAIVVVILFLLPALLSAIINFLNESLGQEGTYKIGSDGNLYCDITSSE